MSLSPLAADELLVMRKQATAFDFVGELLEPVVTLPSGACVWCRDDAPRLTVTGTSSPIVLVEFITPAPVRSGWICSRDALNLEKWMAEDVAKRHIRPRTQPPSERDRREMPALIAIQDEPIRVAWREMERAVAANMKLRPAKRVPEPFLARATIWSLVGNHRDALQDTLLAAEVLQSRGTDLVDFAKYFVVLKDALDEYDRSPEPRFMLSALDYWASSTTDFNQGRFEATLPGLTDAVQLDPGNPLYWYFRALAYRGLGMRREAVHDAKVGAAMEQRAKQSGKSEYLRGLGTRLERIQGPRRNWLEHFRRGAAQVWNANVAD